ncbi:MAG: hypothetical protein K2I81_01765 [Alphaproteobacteria bacterium]|nr:hypothetical protein [Alphaproteobacteria bacterium]
MSKGWDNAMLKKLKALTGKGLSTAEIGKKLGMSKNAVVGKLNRLGWNSKAGGAPAVPEKKAPATKESTKAAPRAAKKTVTAPKAAPKKAATPAKKAEAAPKKTAEKKAPAAPKEAKAAAARPTAAKTTNKTLAMHQRIIQHSLEMASLKPNQCRWPIGDPDSEHFHFCGEQVFVGKPYCYEHCKQAYQFTPPKKK